MPSSGKSYLPLVIFCMILLGLLFLNWSNMNSYGCSDISRHDLQRLCYRVTEDLFAWKENLPSTLEIDLNKDAVPKLPHLLMLQYVTIAIVLIPKVEANQRTACNITKLSYSPIDHGSPNATSNHAVPAKDQAITMPGKCASIHPWPLPNCSKSTRNITHSAA